MKRVKSLENELQIEKVINYGKSVYNEMSHSEHW